MSRIGGSARSSMVFLAASVALSSLASLRARADAPDARWVQELNLRTDLNRLQYFDRSALSTFVTAWSQAGTRGLRVVHFGDSHVQGGTTIQAVRDGLQRELGPGGFGTIFPYTMAKARPPVDYESASKGRWECGSCRVLPPKVPVGVLGIGCRTLKRGASFTVTFKEAPARGRHLLRIFCSRQDRRFRLEVVTNGRRYPVSVNPGPADGSPFVSVRLPMVGPSITVRFLGPQDGKTAFEFRGMILDRVREGGATIYNAGLGATRFRAVLHEEFLEQELRALRPDLVILDYGTNDYLYDDTIRPDLEPTIRQVIHRVRNAVPGVSILLTSTQDLYWKGRNVYSGHLFSDLVARLAREEGCAFFDWFWIAGGPATLLSWQERGLAQTDRIHLTTAGYTLKGHLLFDAMKQTASWIQAHPDAQSLAFDRTALPRPEPPLREEPVSGEPMEEDLP